MCKKPRLAGLVGTARTVASCSNNLGRDRPEGLSALPLFWLMRWLLSSWIELQLDPYISTERNRIRMTFGNSLLDEA
jgi:hypothetical protein